MRIAIIGAGAIGGWLGARLADSGQTVSVLARGKTLAMIRENGLQLTAGGETKSTKISVSDDPVDLGPQDLIVIAVKGPALASVAPTIGQLLGAESAVLPAMNGVPWWFAKGLGGPLAGRPLQSIDPGGAIAKAIPAARVIGCVVHASCSVLEPGQIVHKTGNGLIVGEPNGADTARLNAVADALRGAKFDITVSNRIQQDIWYKLWGNMTMNPISALTGAMSDKILDDELISDFILEVMAEGSEVGRRIGCPIAESGEDRMKVTRKLGAFKTSMLQDAQAGRPLEIDSLLAAPREIAAKVGVKTPYMDALHGLVRLFAATRGSSH
jgi:2-dehydropantoate 2-reductase